MHFVTEFFIASLFALIFLLEAESLGYLVARILKLLYKKNDSQTPIWINNSIIINIFVGLVLMAMLIFTIGIFKLLQPLTIFTLTALPLISWLIFGRWKQISLDRLKYFISSNKYLLLGCLALAIPFLIYAFRPVTSFDGIWYHLAIPKMFLQQGNIDYNGELFRYSVHPYLNFFWNIWALALPFSTAFTSIIINLTQAFLLLITIYWISYIGKNNFGWNKVLQFLGPLILGTCAPFLLGNLGWAYNDLFGLCYGAVVFLGIYILSLEKNTTFFDFNIFLIFICGLFLLKIFFGISALVAFFYLCFTALSKLDFFTSKKPWKEFSTLILTKKSLFLFLILIINFVIFILPWLIRSYYFTGRLLDPIGMPGINEDAYNFAGSQNAENHWRIFLWNRLSSEIFPIFFNRFTPVFGLGMLAIFNEKFREKYAGLWIALFVSFWLVYFANIVQAYRYIFPAIIGFTFLGLALLQILLESKRFELNLKIFLVTVSSIFVLVNISLAGDVTNIYLREFRKGTSLESFMAIRGGQNWSNIQYYQSDLAPKPQGLDPKEPIYISSFVNRTAYINNPYYQFKIQTTKFANIATVKEFVTVLKSLNIRFILDKNGEILNYCKSLKFIDASNCTKENDFWSVDIVDSYQNVVWLRLK